MDYIKANNRGQISMRCLEEQIEADNVPIRKTAAMIAQLPKALENDLKKALFLTLTSQHHPYRLIP